MRDTISRRRAIGTMLAAAAGLALTVDACASPSGSSTGTSSTGAATFWTLQDPTNTVQQAAVNAFDTTGRGKVTMDVIATAGEGHHVFVICHRHRRAALNSIPYGGILGACVRRSRLPF